MSGIEKEEPMADAPVSNNGGQDSSDAEGVQEAIRGYDAGNEEGFAHGEIEGFDEGLRAARQLPTNLQNLYDILPNIVTALEMLAGTSNTNTDLVTLKSLMPELLLLAGKQRAIDAHNVETLLEGLTLDMSRADEVDRLSPNAQLAYWRAAYEAAVEEARQDRATQPSGPGMGADGDGGVGMGRQGPKKDAQGRYKVGRKRYPAFKPPQKVGKGNAEGMKQAAHGLGRESLLQQQDHDTAKKALREHASLKRDASRPLEEMLTDYAPDSDPVQPRGGKKPMLGVKSGDGPDADPENEQQCKPCHDRNNKCSTGGDDTESCLECVKHNTQGQCVPYVGPESAARAPFGGRNYEALYNEFVGVIRELQKARINTELLIQTLRRIGDAEHQDVGAEIARRIVKWFLVAKVSDEGLACLLCSCGRLDPSGEWRAEFEREMEKYPRTHATLQRVDLESYNELLAKLEEQKTAEKKSKKTQEKGKAKATACYTCQANGPGMMDYEMDEENGGECSLLVHDEGGQCAQCASMHADICRVLCSGCTVDYPREDCPDCQYRRASDKQKQKEAGDDGDDGDDDEGKKAGGKKGKKGTGVAGFGAALGSAGDEAGSSHRWTGVDDVNLSNTWRAVTESKGRTAAFADIAAAVAPLMNIDVTTEQVLDRYTRLHEAQKQADGTKRKEGKLLADYAELEQDKDLRTAPEHNDALSMKHDITHITGSMRSYLYSSSHQLITEVVNGMIKIYRGKKKEHTREKTAKNIRALFNELMSLHQQTGLSNVLKAAKALRSEANNLGLPDLGDTSDVREAGAKSANGSSAAAEKAVEEDEEMVDEVE
ncbi:hypothetical protein LTR15_011804 [Elasticomyces elasticus]|nr:hypothetical protein LTR15_011804 [Elasticomyces elasticus]